MRYWTILNNLSMNPFYRDFLKDHKGSLAALGLDKIDPFFFREEYFKNHVADISIDPSANVGSRRPNNYYMEAFKSFEAMMCFQEIMEWGKKIFGKSYSIEPFFSGREYFHDKTKYKMPYCIGVTTTNILMFGKPFGSLHSSPPKRVQSLVNQVKEYIMLLSQQNAGAIAPTDLPVSMAWIMDNESDKEIENCYQNFVHTINNEFRVGGDSPFTNVMISTFTPYERMFGEFRFPDGRTIHDLKDEIERVNKIILDFAMKGDPLRGGMPYRFPIHTIQVTKDDVGSDEFEEFAMKNRLGYFNVNQTEQFSMCCRFMPNGRQMVKTGYFGGGGGMQLGSHRVVTVNLPWCAYEAKGDPEIFEANLINSVHHACKTLVIHKAMLRFFIEKNFLFPFNAGWIKLDELYSTVGIHGFPESIEILGMNPVGRDGIEFGKKMIRLIVNLLDSYSEKYTTYINEKMPRETPMQIMYNLEEIPAEGSTGTMATMNNARFGTNDSFYSNQFVPLYTDIPLHERLNIESEYVSMLTGGSMTFVNLASELDEQQSLKFHERIIKNTEISQFAFNYGWSVCKKCSHTVTGFHEKCEKCGGEYQHWTRVVGYNTPIDFWSKVRKNEHETRIYY